MKPLGNRKGGGANNMSDMLAQAQQMQQSLMDIQDKLADEVVEGSAGNGAVKVSITGKHEVKNIKIDPDVVDPEDIEMLEDMLLTAFNAALDIANQQAASQMNSVTGGLPIPGLDSLF